MKRIIHTPVPMVTPAFDDITMTEFEAPAFNRRPSPTKKLVQIGGKGSYMSLYGSPDHLTLAGGARAGRCRDHL